MPICTSTKNMSANKIITTLLVAVACCFADLSFAQTGKGKIVVLSIGINSTPFNHDGKFQFFSNRFCESDAALFSRYLTGNKIIQKDSTAALTCTISTYEASTGSTAGKKLLKQNFNDAPLNLTQHNGQSIRYDSIYAYTAAAVSFRELDAMFNRLTKQVSPDDIFIFFYAGMSEVFTSKAFGQLPYFGLTDTIRFNSKGELQNEQQVMTSVSIKNWLNKLEAKRQLVIFDAVKGENFFPAFISVAFEKDPLLAGISERNRAFIYNLEMAYESSGIGGGMLTYNMTRMNRDWFSKIFSADPAIRESSKSQFITRQFSSLKETGMRPSASSISFERDYIDFLKGLEFKTASRGNETLQQAKKKNIAAATNYALLIATDDYRDPSWKKLSNPVNDAATIEKELKENYGFQTEILKNPTRRQILETIRKYKTDIRYDSTSQLLIFIAGHGGYDSFVNGFIAASDSRSAEEDPLRDTYIPHSQLRDIINTIDCNHILVVLDVCFGGTFDEKLSAAGSRAEGIYKDVDKAGFIERKLKYRSRLYLTSGGKEYVPDGRPGMHSPFAFRFIDALRSKSDQYGIISFDKLKTALEKVVPEPRAGMFGNGEPGGDFIFIAK